MDIKKLQPATTQLPLNEYNLPVPEVNMRLRGVSDPSLGKEAAMGLKALTGLAGTDFTITSARRHDNEDSMHYTGNAIDFGVRTNDGKSMLNFFFTDDDYTQLSDAGQQYLIDNNAELIDERTRAGQPHFHLEFNSPERSINLLQEDETPLYGKGATTNKEGFPIYGVQGTWQPNDYNQNVDFLKGMKEIAGLDDYVDIGPSSDFYEEFGVAPGTITRATQAEGLMGIARKAPVDPADADKYRPTKLDPYTRYSREEQDSFMEFKTLNLNFAPGYLPDTKQGEQIKFDRTFDIKVKVPFATKKSEYKNFMDKQQLDSGLLGTPLLRDKIGITNWPGASKTEAAADLQTNWQKWTRGAGGGVKAFANVIAQGASMVYAGLPMAVATGEFDQIYNNGLNKLISEYDSHLAEEFPHYYTAAQQADTEGFFTSWDAFRQSLGTANFWSKDFLQGVGFLLGAAKSGSLAAKSGFGARAFDLVSATNRRLFPRQMANSFRKATFKKGVTTLGLAAQYGKKRQVANFIGAGLVSAAGEATIEAQHIFESSYEEIKKAKREGAEMYQGMTDAEMRELAASYSDVAWLANIAIVGSSNMLMFKHLFGSGAANLGSKVAKNTIKKGAKRSLEFKARKLPQWFTRQGKRIQSPIAEGFEEWSQYALELGGKDYFGYTHNPLLDTEVNAVEGFQGMLASMARGMIKTPQTKEGLQGIFLGALLGGLGGAYAGFRGQSERQQHKTKVKQAEQLVEKYNLLNKNGDLYKTMRSIAELKRLDKIQLDSISSEDLFTTATAEMRKAFEIIDLFYETGQIDILNDILNDAGKLSKEEFDAEFEIDPDANVNPVKELNRIKGAIRSYELLKDADPLIQRAVSAAALALQNDEQAEEKLAAMKRELRYSTFMAAELDKKSADMLSEISVQSGGSLGLSFLRDMDLTNKDEHTDAKTKTDAQFEEMLKKPDAPGKAQQAYIADLLNQYVYLNTLRQSFNQLTKAIYDAPFANVNKDFAERNTKEEEAKRQNQAENDKITAAEEFAKQQKAEEEAAKQARQQTKPETAPEGFQQTGETAPEGFTQEGEKSPGRQVVSKETVDRGKRKGKKRIVYSETTEETIQPEGVNIKVTRYTTEIGGKKVGAKGGKQMSLREFLDEYEISEEDQELLSEYDLDKTTITISKETEVPADSRFVNTIDVRVSEKGELGSVEFTLTGKRKTKPAPPAAPTVTPTSPVGQTDDENIKTVNQANTENLEVPENNDVDVDNGNTAQSAQDDGKALGDITYLGDIMSLGYKSVNNQGGYTAPGTDMVTTNILENPEIPSMAGAVVDWSIDMAELERRAGGTLMAESKRISKEAVQKVKNKEPLSQQDLDNLPLLGTATLNGNTIRAYAHTAAYVDTNIKPDHRDGERARIREFRRLVYESINQGKQPATMITEQSIGHLNFDPTIKSKNNISIVLNGGKPGTKQVSLIFNDGFNYVDENGVPVTDIFTTANPRAKGGVYFRLPAANQETFPARAFVENLHRETGEVLLAVYAGVTNKQVSFKTKVTKEFAESLPDKGVMKLYKKYLLEMIEEATPGNELRFTDLINMLIYDKTKGLEIVFTPVSKGTVLKLGSNSYTASQLESKKEEIIDWFVENKRYNVSKIRTNSNNAFKYNEFLVQSKILYTNIFSNQNTGGAFIQPTLRFSNLLGTTKKEAPKTSSQKPEAKHTFSKFTKAEVSPEEGSELKKQVASDSNPVDGIKTTNETAESAQIALNFENSEKEEKKVNKFMFGGVSVEKAEDEVAPEDIPVAETGPEEGVASETAPSEKESPKPNKPIINKNNITFGELKNKPKTNLSKIKKGKKNNDNLEDPC